MATKSTLKRIPYTNHATLNRPARTIKMVPPQCKDCQEENKPLWWETCPHQPYFSVATDTRVEFVTETDEEGNEVITDEVAKTTRIRRLNTAQVPAEDKIYSGKGPQWSREHGWKLPEELGYAPMCEYYNCWTPFPKYHTGWGNYCTSDQAKIMNLRIEGFPIHTDEKVRRRQLNSVQLGDATK